MRPWLPAITNGKECKNTIISLQGSCNCASVLTVVYISGRAASENLARLLARVYGNRNHINGEITSHFQPVNNIIVSRSALIASGSVGLGPVPAALGADEMVQGEGVAGALIAPRRLPNPCLDSPQRMDLHRELLFNQKIGKNVLNQKSELQKALSKHKEKQILNQVKEHKETPELERAIAERARRLEASDPGPEPDPATNPTLQEVRARLRHAATNSPAASQ